MKATEITEENLEDLLTYDDLFMEYFNAFMALPAFPQALQYDRLTGTFQETEGKHNSIAGSVVLQEDAQPYGVTDDERELMLEWCKTERLPCFLRTELFRELKLCKLLLRTLDDRCSASRVSSRAIRGYSRTSESYVSSLSNSMDNSANDEESDYDDELWVEYDKSALYKYERPGSRALSLPPKLRLVDFIKSTSDSYTALSQVKSTAEDDSRPSLDAKEPQSGVGADSGLGTSVVTENTLLQSEPTFNTRNQTLVSIQEDSSSNANNSRDKSTKTLSAGLRQRRMHKRAISAPINYNEFLRLPSHYSDFDMMFGEEEPTHIEGQRYVEFTDEMISDQQTETDVRQLEGKHHMTVDEMKEKLLSSLSGFEAFKKFLKGTNGESLVNFWLDCESFKDEQGGTDDLSRQAARNQIFRDIKDKYKMSLTTDAQRQIAKVSSDSGVSNTVFIRTQYDVLRRLRSYWLPRFVIHKEHVGELKLKNPEVSASRIPPQRIDNSSFLPSISLVNSIPVKPEDVLLIATTKSWEMVSKGGRRLDERITSARPFLFKSTFTAEADDDANTSIREKIGLALWFDKVAGGPFQTCLSRDNNQLLVSNLLFWQDVTEYGVSHRGDSDRLLRLTRAWNIFNRFLAMGSRHNIGIHAQLRDHIHNILLTSTDFVDNQLFDTCKRHAVGLLEEAWIRFLKEDMKKFLDCHVWRDEEEEPPSTADDIEVIVLKERVIVRRPWVRRDKRYPPSTCSERARRLKTALTMAESIDESKLAEQRKRRQERRKAIEKERKKAVRNAYRRQKEAKMSKSKPKDLQPKLDSDDKAGDQEDGGGEVEGGELNETSPRSARSKPDTEIVEEDKPVTFPSQKDNKPMITLFKKYLHDHDSKDSLHVVNMYFDIDQYSHTTQKQKKDIQATFIQKTYFDPNSKKAVKLSDRLYTKLSSEKDRPRSATMHDAQKYVTSQLNELFREFWKVQAEEFGVDEKTLGQMSQAELAMRGESDASLMKGFAGKLGKSGAKGNLKKGDQLTPIVAPPSVHFSPTVITKPPVLHTVTHKPRKKTTGRAQPAKEDKQTFLTSLGEASAGKPPLQMLYFYKYLVKHGEEDGLPNIDKDLFFYIEVQKFKTLSHAFANEELIRCKCQAILDCFLDCASLPSCQIDVTPDMSLKTVRNAQRAVQGKDPLTSGLFDEPQYMVFKELLPYWAGFIRGYTQPEDMEKLPVTKTQRLLRKRLEEFNTMPAPNKDFRLPALTIPGAKVAAFTFTITDGISIREPAKETNSEESLEEPSSDTPVATDTPESMRRTSILGGRRGRTTTLAEIKEAA